MAANVASVAELHQRRRSSIKDGKITHARVFLIVTNDIAHGTAVALFADDGTRRVPAYNDPYPGSIGVRVTSIDAEPVQDSGIHFEVTVEYGGLDLTADGVSPLDEPPEITWGSSETTEPDFIDRSDPPKAVVNSAGDPFDQFMERECGHMTITITRNEPTHDANAADLLSHTVNNDPVYIDGTTFAPGTLKLSPITATKSSQIVMDGGVEQEVVFYRKTYVLKARRDGWRDKPLDVGTNELLPDPSDGMAPKLLRPIVDSCSRPVAKPWPLDGNGAKRVNPTDTPEVLEFKPYVERPFAPLAFGVAPPDAA